MSDKTKQTEKAPEFHFQCFHCKKEKYCQSCMLGYTSKDNFCSRCGQGLTSFEPLENQDCPLCSQNKRLASSYKIMKVQIVGVRSLSEEQLFPKRFGLIISKVCSCGKYRPKSTEGLIDSHCANCGGTKRRIVLR